MTRASWRPRARTAWLWVLPSARFFAEEISPFFTGWARHARKLTAPWRAYVLMTRHVHVLLTTKKAEWQAELGL